MNMDMSSFFSALSLFAVCIYMYIGILSYRQGNGSMIHRTFLLLCMSYAIWAFAYSFAYVSTDKHVFEVWNKISAIGWCSFSALILFLVLLISKNKWAQNTIVVILLFSPAFLFFFIAVFLFKADVPAFPILSSIFYIGNFLYNFVYLFASILLFFFWGKKSNSLRVKKQSKILVLSSVIPFLLNLITQDILPLFGLNHFPLMGQLYSLIMILGIYIVITKYHFLKLPEKVILEEVTKEILDMVIITDEKGKIIRVSKHTLNMLGYEEVEILKQSVERFFNSLGKNVTFETIIHKNNKFDQLYLMKKNGEKIPVNISCKQIYETNLKELLGYIFVVQDISLLFELQLKNQKLKESEESFRSIIEHNPMSIQIINSNGHTKQVNQSFIDLFGVVPHADYSIFEDRQIQEQGLHELMARAKTGEVVYLPDFYYDVNVEQPEADGATVWIRAIIFPIIKNGMKTEEYVIMHEDITERIERQNQIKYLSYHDQLTGLYNRRYLEDELKRLDDEKYYPLSVVMADVNGLKLINDSFGHHIGDELLKKVTQIIAGSCREEDIAARLGGDEFVILLPKTSVVETEKRIKEIKAAAAKEKIEGLDISVSFGYEIKRSQSLSMQEVLKKAEDQMYKKKLFESPSIRGKTVQTIINTLHEKNKREEQHSHRVSALCKRLGVALSLRDNEIAELKTVGLLHDIGKIAIEDAILNKPSKLSEEEEKQMMRHPEIGYRILSTVHDMSDIATFVLYHHERIDGKGYPKGLKGDQIPLESRIISIVDSYDAMTSERSYQGALSEEEAITELKKNAGTQLDAELVSVFINKVLRNQNA